MPLPTGTNSFRIRQQVPLRQSLERSSAMNCDNLSTEMALTRFSVLDAYSDRGIVITKPGYKANSAEKHVSRHYRPM